MTITTTARNLGALFMLVLATALPTRAFAEAPALTPEALAWLQENGVGTVGSDEEEPSQYCFFLRFLADNVLLFPEWDPVFFDEPPAPVGTLGVSERTFTLRKGIDGCPLDVTVFEPLGTAGPRPTLVWVQGSNVQPYYQQSLHETLASWGYVVIVPDTRPLTFIPDPEYHARNVGNALLVIDRAATGRLRDVEVDPERIAAGGYSIGATMTTFVAALSERVKAQVLWAPTDAPFWSGVTPEELWPEVTAPALLLLGEKDDLAPPAGFPKDMQAAMAGSDISEIIIQDGTHLFFQQPTGADTILDPPTDLTRFDQQGFAIQATQHFLFTELVANSAQ